MQFAHVARTLAFALGSAVFLQCATLPELATDVCGNGVVDDGEDCDDIASGASDCGAAGTAQACRFTCAIDADAGVADAGDAGAAARPACPEGYGCGVDSICRTRAPDKPYVASAPEAVGADRIFAANLAGTGKYSVLAVSRDFLDLGYPRLLAYDQTGTRTADQTLQGSFGLGAAADADGDGRDDVLFSRTDGLLLSLGEGDTTLNAVATDFITLPAQAHVTLLTTPGSSSLTTPGARTSEILALISNLSIATSAGTADPSHSYLSGSDLSVGLLADFDETWPAQAAGGLAAFGDRVSTLPDPAFQCERIVFAQRGGRALDTVQPCCPIEEQQGKNACSGRLVRGPQGLRDSLSTTTDPILFGPWSVDVDGDGRQDVVVVTRAAAPVDPAAPVPKPRLEVAYGTATVPTLDPVTRGFAPTKQLTVGVTSEDEPVLDLPDELSTVLDVGTETRQVQVIDAQNRVTFETRRFLTLVGPNSLFFYTYQSPTTGTLQAGNRRTSSWTAGKLASFNDDAFLDVIGGRSRSVDLDVGLGTSDLGLNLTSVRTGLSTDELELADVDGDGTSDVLLASNAGGTSTLSMLFGNRGSFPTEVTSLGTFQRIVQVVAAPLQFPGFGTDSSADVGLVTRITEGGGQPGTPRTETDSVTVLRSVGGRVPYSLYGLVASAAAAGEQADVIASPLASTLVRRATGTGELVALGSDSSDIATVRLWSGAVTAGDRVSLSAPVPGAKLDIDMLIGDASEPGTEITDFGVNALLAAIDLDGDGDEEVVGVSTDRTETTPVLFTAATSSSGYQVSLPPTTVSAAPGLARVFGLAVVDVTGDGRDDVVLILASAPDFTGNGGDTDFLDLNARTSSIVVVPNQNGQLVPSAATVLAPPGDARALAVGHPLVPGAAQLVVATTTGIYVYSAGSFSALYTDQPGQPRLAASTRSMAVADVTGDGVDDIVLGTHDRLTVLRAETTNP